MVKVVHSVREVIVRFFPDYARSHRMRADVQHAARRIIQCGTAAMGAHVRRCQCGHIDQIRYNSCRHRCCPSCSGGKRASWLERFSRELLPCDHVHVIFTIPDSLNRFWQFNRVRFSNLLLQAARESLLKLLADPKFLGAQPGILSVLHTWGRNLSVHPHVHCLVSAGGVDSSGRFVHQTRSTLLPARVLMMVFRGRFRSLLEAAVANDKLALPDRMTQSEALALFKCLSRQPWNVRIQERYEHGVSVAGYLARYMAGGPIADRRLHSVTESQVTFRYRSYAENRIKLMRLVPQTFLTRWLEHVPPRGLRMIRRSGLYANCHANLRKQLQNQLLGQQQIERPAAIPLDSERCPQCNSVIRTVEIVRPAFTWRYEPQVEPWLQQGQPP